MRNISMYAIALLLLCGACGNLHAQESSDRIKLPPIWDGINEAPINVLPDSDYLQINLSHDRLSGVVVGRKKHEDVVREIEASFIVPIARAGCPCCPAPQGVGCCVYCDYGFITGMNLKSTRIDTASFSGESGNVLRTTFKMPSKGTVILKALSFVDKNPHSKYSSEIEFTLKVVGKESKDWKEVKRLDPPNSTAGKRFAVSMQREFEVTPDEYTFSIEARGITNYTGDIIGRRIILISFVPDSSIFERMEGKK